MATATPAVEPQEVDEAKLALEGSDDKGDVIDEGDKGDEAKTDEEKAAEELAERLKPIEKTDGSMETDEEAKARVAAEDAATAEPTELGKVQEKLDETIQLLRISKREQVQMKAKLDRLEKKSVKAKGDEEEEEEEGDRTGSPAGEPLSRVEQLQNAITQIGAERGASLDLLLATMEQGTYKDVKSVCSRSNFDDVFEVIASEMAKEGRDYDESLLEVELSIWAKENPYLYMYDLIKQYHPSYAQTTAKPGSKGKEAPTVVVAPGSISDKGGDSSVKTGWTSERIDNLPEDQLGTVPKDVYDKYMAGTLD